MPCETTDTTGPYCFHGTYGACPTPYIITLGKSIICSNAPDRRIKPTGFGKLSLTAQSKQSTYIATPCLYSWGSHTHDLVWMGYKDPDATNWQLDLRLKIKGEKLNLGQSLAEYRETVDLFKKLARELHRAYLAAKRGNLPTLTRPFTCHAASTVLMANFGINPLINDVGASLERLNGRLIRPIKRRFIVTKKKDIGAFSGGEPRHYSFKGKCFTSERAIFYAEFSKIPNFSLGNPLELAWELTPMSFVVDWMVPVGDYLSSLDALEDVSDIYGTVTTKVVQKGTYDLLYHRGATYNPTIRKNGTVNFSSHERKVYYTVPFADLPSYEPSTSLKSVLNGLSLLRQMSQGCKSPTTTGGL